MSTKDLASMVGDLARLVLVHSDSLGHLEATLFFTMIVPDNSEVVKAGREEGAAYHRKVTDAEDKSKSFGPSHVFICTASIAKMKTLNFQEKEDSKEHQD